MMINIIGAFHVVILFEGQDGDLQEWYHDSKNEPNVHHPNVRGGRQLLHDTNEDRSHHQHCCQIDGQCSLKEEGFKKCCAIPNQDQ